MHVPQSSSIRSSLCSVTRQLVLVVHSDRKENPVGGRDAPSHHIEWASLPRSSVYRTPCGNEIPTMTTPVVDFDMITHDRKHATSIRRNREEKRRRSRGFWSHSRDQFPAIATQEGGANHCSNNGNRILPSF